MIPRVLAVEPGNSTRYVLVLMPITSVLHAAILGCAVGAVLVTLWPGQSNCAACVLVPGAYHAPYYLSEKLRVGDADAQALSVILHEELSNG